MAHNDCKMGQEWQLIWDNCKDCIECDDQSHYRICDYELKLSCAIKIEFAKYTNLSKNEDFDLIIFGDFIGQQVPSPTYIESKRACAKRIIQ